MLRVHRGVFLQESAAGRLTEFCLTSSFSNLSTLLAPPCVNPQSILEFFYAPSDFTAPQQPQLLQDIDARVEQILNSTQRELFLQLMGNTFDEIERKGPVTRAVFPFATPLEGFRDSNDRFDEQESRYIDFILSIRDDVLEQINQDAKDVQVRMVWLEFFLLNRSFDAVVFGDTIFALIAVVVLWLYIWFHTGSVFLSLGAMLHILLSFGWAAFVFVYAFQISIFPFLNILGIYIILGIGADDVFIYLDAWKQSRKINLVCKSQELRTAWTFSRASKSMFITSLTTAVAFFINASSSVIFWKI